MTSQANRVRAQAIMERDTKQIVPKGIRVNNMSLSSGGINNFAKGVFEEGYYVPPTGLAFDALLIAYHYYCEGDNEGLEDC